MYHGVINCPQKLVTPRMLYFCQSQIKICVDTYKYGVLITTYIRISQLYFYIRVYTAIVHIQYPQLLVILPGGACSDFEVTLSYNFDHSEISYPPTHFHPRICKIPLKPLLNPYKKYAYPFKTI
jgi:hypothetical protein